jgi:NitT/TauT family transport system permease protein
VKNALPPLALLAVLLGAWQIACQTLAIPPYFLPAPTQIGAALVAGAPILAQAALRTFLMAMTALTVASLFATSLALVISINPRLDQAVRPLAVAIQVTPVVAIAPIVVIWAGVGHPENAIVVLAAIVAFFPIFSGVARGLKATDPDLERVFDLYGATPIQRLTRLRLPSALPFMIEGHKVAVGLAIIGAVVAEWVAGSGGAQGLAWRILEASNRLQTDRMFAAVLVLALMAMGLHYGFQFLEARALKWWRGR